MIIVEIPRDIKSIEAIKKLGISDKTLNEYGDKIQLIFPDYAGGVVRNRKYNRVDLAMVREYVLIKNLPHSEIEKIMIATFCGNNARLTYDTKNSI